jgi:hypothetical protein
MKSALMKKTLALLALGLITTGTQASWDRNDQGYDRRAYQQSQRFSQQIDARQDQQRERIMAGKHAGRLTRAEFRRLQQEQREIRAMEQRFRADGLIDAREFLRLDRALNVASRNIRAEKHDRQARNAYGNPYRFN